MARRDASELFGEEHTRHYRETGGEYGHDWRGTATLLLTTKGRKSGEARTLPLIYGTAGDAYLVVASNGGDDDPPAWFKNLQADPQAELQVLDEVFPVRARIATPEEKPEMWAQMVGYWPDYDNYQRKTSREIPIVVLERV